MPRYFFSIYNGHSVIDLEGTELPDYDHVRKEAIAVAGRALDSDTHRIALGEEWSMEVTNQAGLVLFRLDFLVAEPPATWLVK
jgi:hypothetical protein